MMWSLLQFMPICSAPLLCPAVHPIDFNLPPKRDEQLSLSHISRGEQPVSQLSQQAVKEQDQLTVALSVFQELLQFHQSAGNIAEEATTWFRLGDIYQQIDQFSQALNSYEEAIAHYQIVEDAIGEVNALSHLGKAYEKQGWLSCALEHYEQALAKLRQNSDYLDDATTLSRLATCIEDMF